WRLSLLVLVASFLVYLALALFLDGLAVPRGGVLRRPLWAHALAVLSLTLHYAAWFAISWRPVFATGSGLVTFGLVTAISNYKFGNVQEPLNFMDFVLIKQIWRHPQLYQAKYLRHPVFVAGIAVVLGYVVFWCSVFEPSMLPVGHLWDSAVPFGVLVAVI